MVLFQLGERKLYLAIEATNGQSIRDAINLIFRILKEEVTASVRAVSIPHH